MQRAETRVRFDLYPSLFRGTGIRLLRCSLFEFEYCTAGRRDGKVYISPGSEWRPFAILLIEFPDHDWLAFDLPGRDEYALPSQRVVVGQSQHIRTVLKFAESTKHLALLDLKPKILWQCLCILGQARSLVPVFRGAFAGRRAIP